MEDFKIMLENWIVDHKNEMEDLVIGTIYFDEELGWVVDAEDKKNIYILTEDGTGNIRLDYIGTKDEKW